MAVTKKPVQARKPKRYAVVDRKGVVQNVALWDGVQKWTPPKGHKAVLNERANIGDKWDGKRFVPLTPMAMKPTTEDDIIDRVLVSNAMKELVRMAVREARK